MQDKKLPVPRGLTTKTQGGSRPAKTRAEALPPSGVGAPPVNVPRFDVKPSPPVVGMPQLQPGVKRSPEEIRQDMKAAAEALTKQGGDVKEPRREDAVTLDAPEATKKPVMTPPPEDDRTFSELSDFAFPSATPVSDADKKFGISYENEELRKAVVARIGTIDINSLILYGSVVQRVVLVPGVLEAEFRTMTPAEDLKIKEWIYNIKGSESFVLDTIQHMTLGFGVKSINGNELPPIIEQDSNGTSVISKDLFDRKLNVLREQSSFVLFFLNVAYGWFAAEVQKTMVTEALKNS